MTRHRFFAVIILAFLFGTLVGYPAANAQPTAATPALFWDDLVISPTATKLIGGTYDTNGTVQLRSAQDDHLFAMFQLPHGWAEGTNIHPHIHWYRPTSAAGTVKLQARCDWANIGENFSTTFTSLPWVQATHEVETGTVAGRQGIAEWYLDGTGKSISSVAICQIMRQSAGGADTYGTTVNVVSVDAHIQRSRAGSYNEFYLP